MQFKADKRKAAEKWALAPLRSRCPMTQAHLYAAAASSARKCEALHFYLRVKAPPAGLSRYWLPQQAGRAHRSNLFCVELRRFCR